MGRKILLLGLVVAPVCGLLALPASASTPTPTIKSFSPTSGPVGTEVTIEGTNLAGVTEVKFNATIAALVSDTATNVTAEVPAGATTGYIKVKTPGGKASSASEFVVLATSATTTTPASSSIVIGTGNSDSAVVSGNATYGSPTGTVTFYECGPTASPEPCTSQANQVGSPVAVTAGANDTSSASSVSFTPSSAGYWCFAGFYSGDANYAGSSDTTTEECFDVTTGTAPSATTTTLASSSIMLGYGNSDSAVVSGNATYASPRGTVTFYECGPTSSPEPCTSQANQVGSPVAVTAGANDTSSASSVSFTPSSAGYWCFAGYYSGDANYAGSSDTTTDECFDVTGPSISTVQISKSVKAPKVTISGSGFGTVANLGSPRAACGSRPTGLDYWNHFLFDDTTEGWSAGEGSPTYDCIGVVIKSYSNEEVVFTFGSDYGHYRTGSGKALLNSGDQFTMTLLGASFSGTADYTTGATSATTTTPASSSIVIGTGNSDSAVVSGNATYGSPTGTVTFYECGPTASPEPCTSQANQVGSPVAVTAGANDTSSASSVSFTPNSGGYWCFAGYYSGDANYAGSLDTTTEECFDVTPGQHLRRPPRPQRARASCSGTRTATVRW